MSETEGAQREHKEVEVPKPQTYHTYCQICMVNYEDYDEHVQNSSHITRAKNQIQIPQIDELITELNQERRWESSTWVAEPKQDKRGPKPIIRFVISKDNKITLVHHNHSNVASRKHIMQATQNANAGRKSGRVSVAGAPGKQSRTSLRSSNNMQIVAEGKGSLTSKRVYTPNKRSLDMVNNVEKGWSARKKRMY